MLELQLQKRMNKDLKKQLDFLGVDLLTHTYVFFSRRVPSTYTYELVNIFRTTPTYSYFEFLRFSIQSTCIHKKNIKNVSTQTYAYSYFFNTLGICYLQLLGSLVIS